MGSEQTADEVFQVLSDEARLDVLRTVAVAQHENKKTGVAALSFSEIYDREDDIALLPSMAEKSVNYCEHGQLQIFSDSSHWVHHEREEVTEALCCHLSCALV